MSDYGTPIGPDAVRFERILPGPIERVWEYLTKSEQRGTWQRPCECCSSTRT